MSAIDRAVKQVGSEAALADRLGVTASAVYQWRSGNRPVPAARCPDIEAATNGAVRCEDLRPDVNWAVVRGNTEQATQEAA